MRNLHAGAKDSKELYSAASFHSKLSPHCNVRVNITSAWQLPDSYAFDRYATAMPKCWAARHLNCGEIE